MQIKCLHRSCTNPYFNLRFSNSNFELPFTARSCHCHFPWNRKKGLLFVFLSDLWCRSMEISEGFYLRCYCSRLFLMLWLVTCKRYSRLEGWWLGRLFVDWLSSRIEVFRIRETVWAFTLWQVGCLHWEIIWWSMSWGRGTWKVLSVRRDRWVRWRGWCWEIFRLGCCIRSDLVSTKLGWGNRRTRWTSIHWWVIFYRLLWWGLRGDIWGSSLCKIIFLQIDGLVFRPHDILCGGSGSRGGSSGRFKSGGGTGPGGAWLMRRVLIFSWWAMKYQLFVD